VALATETLTAQKREAQGTRACRRLRAEGRIPAVLYGRQEQVLSLQVVRDDLETALRHHSRMFELDLQGQKQLVLLKELQYDAFGDEVVHADFMRIAMDEKVTLKVTVVLKGAPKAEHAVLQQTLAQVEVECLPTDIPESIVAPVGDLTVGQSLQVSQLVLPPGVVIVTEGDVIVATLTAAAAEEAVAAAPAAEGLAEPEVIGRKAQPEEGQEEDEEKKK